MPRIRKPHHRSSRRVPPPKDSDFDHEINLVDNSEAEDGDSVRPATGDPSSAQQESPQKTPSPGTVTDLGNGDDRGARLEEPRTGAHPSIQIEEATPSVEDPSRLKSSHSNTADRQRKPKTPESAIDILYENQRGGFLCGIALFSAKALGVLDPPAWTNFAHKASPTNINNAQVPDPSWEWAWPEWRINQDDGTDPEGWEYSFAFSKRLSWHKARWWNSFVRRRAWIRKRVKKDSEYASADSHMLNPEYFTVRASSELSRDHSPSRGTALSLRGSRLSMSTVNMDEAERPDIEHVDELLRVLRASRIDREKIEAVENYLEHAQEDFEGLEKVMHELMSLFVFQASRRALLTRLTEVSDQAAAQKGKGKDKEVSEEVRRRADNLAAAVKHADEEVRRLEYWSDVKGMAEEGDSMGAADRKKGWDPSWQGVDKSGPAAPAPPHAKEGNKSTV